MKRWVLSVLFGISGLLMVQNGSAIELIHNDTTTMNFGGRLQLLGVGESVNDDTRNDNRIYLYMRQARLHLSGETHGMSFYSEIAFGGEDVIVSTSGISLGLLDMRVDLPLSDSLKARLGQFKVPYSQEALADDGQLLFDGRSINDLAFKLGRDIGAALSYKKGMTSAAFGVFTGGSRDVPERYLPEALGIPLVVLRAGIDDINKDAFSDGQSGVVEADGVHQSFYINGAFMKDSLIGHSSVLNVRPADKSLLLNSNWNPFIGQHPLDDGSVLWQGGLDWAMGRSMPRRKPMFPALKINTVPSIWPAAGSRRPWVRNRPSGLCAMLSSIRIKRWCLHQTFN